MPDRRSVWVIIVAGGAGKRFGGPKHAQLLGSKAMWQHSSDTFHAAGIPNIVVVGDVPGGVPGGESRSASVRAGLRSVPDTAEWILVHDAARPLVTVEIIDRVLNRVLQGDVDCVVPTVPVSDTIKRISGETIVETVNRSQLVSAQTPQAFRAGALRAAHSEHAREATDDAGLVAAISGASVVQVMGDPANLKITYPQDMAVADAWLTASKQNE